MGTGRHRAASEVGEVRVAGKTVVTQRVLDDERLPRPLHVAQHRHRQRLFTVPVSGAEPVLLLVAPQQQVHAGGPGHRAEDLGHPGVQPVDVGLRAQRL
jgi:hypothetical protein